MANDSDFFVELTILQFSEGIKFRINLHGIRITVDKFEENNMLLYVNALLQTSELQLVQGYLNN